MLAALVICFIVAAQGGAYAVEINPPLTIRTGCSEYTFINSVDFHPTGNLFCTTYTHCDQVALYQIEAGHQVTLVQKIGNPTARLTKPQHALFSPDGKKLVVVNWDGQELTIYPKKTDRLFSESPEAVIPFPSVLGLHRPHGMAFSPCGNYLAMAFGVTSREKKAIAIFQLFSSNTIKLICMLEKELPGIPKGIVFSPDGKAVLVTFSDINAVVVYDLNEKMIIDPVPRQLIQGEETKICRPEDIKITADGSHCAVTNSEQHTVTFYPFDKTRNLIMGSTPSTILKNPEAHLCFPHGIAFSTDGAWMAITQFGPVVTTKKGGFKRLHILKAEDSKVGIYNIFIKS